jgi:hypothetical protein
VDGGRTTCLTRPERDQVGAKSGSGVVEEGHDPTTRRAPIAACQQVPGVGAVRQERVKGDIERLRECEKGVETQSSLPRLSLGNSARRHTGQSSYIGLCQRPF